LHGAKRWDEAIAAYEAGIAIEDSPALKKGLQEVQEAKGIKCLFCYETTSEFYYHIHLESDASLGGGFGKLFSDPNILAKLAANPKTAPFLADQSFVQKVSRSLAKPKTH
jgi:stress-induced-phosphoprotein 1